LAVLTAVSVPVAVLAAGGHFTDDDDSIFEADINWMADSGVTLGCNPPANDHYCPDNYVTRGQMAAFMHRLSDNQVVDAATSLEADHATAADTATNADSADYATNADTVDNLHALAFQPSTVAGDTGDATVNANANYTIAEASVSATVNNGICLFGDPTAYIRIDASALVSGLGATENASFRLEDSSGTIVGTARSVSTTEGYASVATNWLYPLVNGGSETFSFVAYESGGDVYSVSNGVIIVEVVRDTQCAPIIFFPLDSSDSVDPEAAAG